MFYSLYSLKRETTPGPDVKFNCPRCGAQAGSGHSYEYRDTILALYLIPVLRSRSTYVTCRHCQAALTSALSVEELQQHGNTDLSAFVFDDVSFVFKFLAIAALLLCWTPIVGLGLALGTLAGTFRRRCWARTVALVSLVPAVLITIVAIAAVLSS